MKADTKAVDLAKQIARQKLEGRNGTGTGTGNFEIVLGVIKDIQTALPAQGHNLSKDKLRTIVLDEMVETGRFQIGGTPSQIRTFRLIQITLAVMLLALLIIALTLGNTPSYIRFQLCFAVAVASISLPYIIFSINGKIRSLRHINILES